MKKQYPVNAVVGGKWENDKGETLVITRVTEFEDKQYICGIFLNGLTITNEDSEMLASWTEKKSSVGDWYFSIREELEDESTVETFLNRQRLIKAVGGVNVFYGKTGISNTTLYKWMHGKTISRVLLFRINEFLRKQGLSE